MKATGIVRRLDGLGRIVIPMELRKTLGIKDGDPLEIFVDGDRVILRKYEPEHRCCICGSSDIKIVGIKNKMICRACTKQILDMNIGVDLQRRVD